MEILKTPCTQCEEGTIYVDTSGSCGVYIGDCCGGCGQDEDCEDCEGTGVIELDLEEVVEMRESNPERFDEIYYEATSEETKHIDNLIEEQDMKFNGFEANFIVNAIREAVDEAEHSIEAHEEKGKQCLFGKGYFRDIVGKDMIEKVKHFTKKADLIYIEDEESN